MDKETIFQIIRKKLREILSQGPLLSPITDEGKAAYGQGTPQPTQTPQPSATPQPQFGRMSYYLPTGGQTATGTDPVSGYTAAISRELKDEIPMGSLLKLPNGMVVRVEDLTAREIQDTLDLFYSSPEQATYPEKGLMKDVPYSIIGRNTEGLRYNY